MELNNQDFHFCFKYLISFIFGFNFDMGFYFLFKTGYFKLEYLK